MDSLLLLTLTHIVFTAAVLPADGKYFHILKTCQFIERGSQLDVQYLIQYHYSGRLQAQYNSSTEKLVGLTDYGSWLANKVNKDFDYLEHRRIELNYFCKVLAVQGYRRRWEVQEPPITSLRWEADGDSMVLVCSAYDFYPKQIRVSWLRDGAVIPETSSLLTAAWPNGAWRYQIHSYLEEPESSGQKIGCMVEHISLQEPRLMQLDQSGPASDAVQSALGVSALVLGVLVLLSGGIFNWRRARSASG